MKETRRRKNGWAQVLVSAWWGAARFCVSSRNKTGRRSRLPLLHTNDTPMSCFHGEYQKAFPKRPFSPHVLDIFVTFGLLCRNFRLFCSCQSPSYCHTASNKHQREGGNELVFVPWSKLACLPRKREEQQPVKSCKGRMCYHHFDTAPSLLGCSDAPLP